MEYLLDTHICIYIIKEKPSVVFEKFKLLVPENVGVSSITAAELDYGIQKRSIPDKNRNALDRFLLSLDAVDLSINLLWLKVINWGSAQ